MCIRIINCFPFAQWKSFWFNVMNESSSSSKYFSKLTNLIEYQFCFQDMFHIYLAILDLCSHKSYLVGMIWKYTFCMDLFIYWSFNDQHYFHWGRVFIYLGYQKEVHRDEESPYQIRQICLFCFFSNASKTSNDHGLLNLFSS